MDMPYFFSRSSAPVRRAVVREGIGRITDSIVADPGLRYKEAEREMLQAASEAGLPATDKHIQIKGDPGKPKARRMISHPGRPARTMTRREENGTA